MSTDVVNKRSITMKYTLLALLLSGCMSTGRMIQSHGERIGAPQWEIDAISHGCTSGESAAGNMFASFTKDYNQYNSNPMYAQKYEDNYRRCFNEWKNSIFHKKGY